MGLFAQMLGVPCLDIVVIERHPGGVQCVEDDVHDVGDRDRKAIDARRGFVEHLLDHDLVALVQKGVRQRMENERQAQGKAKAPLGL